MQLWLRKYWRHLSWGLVFLCLFTVWGKRLWWMSTPPELGEEGKGSAPPAAMAQGTRLGAGGGGAGSGVSTRRAPRPTSQPPERVGNPFCDCPEETPRLSLTVPPQTGAAVRDVQLLLTQAGFAPGSLDGVFGVKTERAVRAFQKQAGLTPDGVVGWRTWRALGETGPAAGRRNVPPPPRGKISILVEIDATRLTVFNNGQPYHQFLVAVGKSSTPSPVGDWRIVDKQRWGGGFGSRWMKLSVPWGKYGIHGTNRPNSIGSETSHGCIRMWNRDVEVLYDWVPIGTPVKIIKGNLDPLGLDRESLVVGSRGTSVWVVQAKLKQLGFYRTIVDGIYGGGTEQAVREFQKRKRLPVTGRVDQATYDKLGLFPFE